MRAVLLVGGAPRIAVDAVRFLTVSATGATALRLQTLLRERGHPGPDLLLSRDAMPHASAARYGSRDDLEQELRGWVQAQPEGIVVMSAAVNDYQLESVETSWGASRRRHAVGQKIPSGADALQLRLVPASKLIDQLRPWGLRGPIVGFKLQERSAVQAAARALRERTGAEVVLGNSIEGDFQALVDAQGEQSYATRAAVLAALADRIVLM